MARTRDREPADHDFSVEGWRARRSRVVELADGVAVRIKLLDVLALLDGGGDVQNPLMSMVAQHTGQADPTAPPDPDMVYKLRKGLNDLLIRVVIEPPLVEQGHADGISVDEFTLNDKLAVFVALAGGEDALSAAVNFPWQPLANLVTVPAIEDLGNAAQ